MQALVIFYFMLDYFTHMPDGRIYIIGATEQYSQGAGALSASQAPVLPPLGSAVTRGFQQTFKNICVYLCFQLSVFKGVEIFGFFFHFNSFSYSFNFKSCYK